MSSALSGERKLRIDPNRLANSLFLCQCARRDIPEAAFASGPLQPPSPPPPTCTYAMSSKASTRATDSPLLAFSWLQLAVDCARGKVSVAPRYKYSNEELPKRKPTGLALKRPAFLLFYFKLK